MESDNVNDRILKTEQVVELRRIYKLPASKSCFAVARYRYVSPAGRRLAGEKYRFPIRDFRKAVISCLFRIA
jgi:hypothetical protein